jgi:hypothetical protein
MATYRRNNDDRRSLNRCAVCDVTVIVEGPCGRPAENNVCAACGTTLVDPPFEGGDYFDVIMRAGRPIKRGTRLRRAG